ncbi:BgTH12-06150 [Blumeria graminis f. sp. triticale]|uniref:BgtE-20127-2 n=2 Tax=Blumeria graminis TaxID=34373 RepID=A0A9X9MKQ6_BLUGR|nr:BgTH12-06150 [Blumeria graminis f. sp. triticale]VDB91275.1 BgtE-20127-2 [Blumeria graminis f. sp. tritici]
MNYLHHIFRDQCLWTKVLFITLLSSTHASLIQRRMLESTEPSYHCRNKILLFSEVDKIRESACKGFVSKRSNARRPLVHIENDNDENLIYEWTIPPSVHKIPGGKKKKSIEKIIFNNSCELKDVLFYNETSRKFEPCAIVPEASTSETFGMKQVLTETSVHCGSLSWEIADMQDYIFYTTLNAPHIFSVVSGTANQVDGPWQKAMMNKSVLIGKNSRRIPYEVIVNNQFEIRNIVVKHHISRILDAASGLNYDEYNQPNFRPTLRQDIIRLDCILDKKIPILRDTQIPKSKNDRKRKTLE